ncbi:MAG: glycosyltransferase family 2 protein, partial [Candidatus Methanosuratincola petrocarbonis]
MKVEKRLGARGKAIPKDEVTVVIPVLNEEGGIQKVLRELKKCGFDKVIVVDGGSTDRTIELAREEGALVLFQLGKGKGDAIRTAVPHIPTEYALIMDGDHTYDPECIRRLLDQGDYYDEVVGVREKEKIPRLHRFGNWAITKVFNLLFDTA